MGALVFFALLFYFMPGIVAVYRKKESATAMMFMNLVFGWTFIGWAAVFIWALSGKRGS